MLTVIQVLAHGHAEFPGAAGHLPALTPSGPPAALQGKHPHILIVQRRHLELWGLSDLSLLAQLGPVGLGSRSVLGEEVVAPESGCRGLQSGPQLLSAINLRAPQRLDPI